MPCNDYRPDHNGECLNCDEWADAHNLPPGPADERLLDLFRQLPTIDLKLYARGLELVHQHAKDATLLFCTHRLKLIARVLEERPA